MLECESLRSKRCWTSFNACCTALCTSGISILETTSKVLSGIRYSRSVSEDSGSGRLISNPRIEPDRWRRGLTRRTGSIRGSRGAGEGGGGGGGGGAARGGGDKRGRGSVNG